MLNNKQSPFSDNEIEDEKIKKRILSKLNEIAQEHSEKLGVGVETMVAKGSVYDKVCEVADMISADLIVMGTNGADNMSDYFLGTTAENVIKSANCPVLVIPILK